MASSTTFPLLAHVQQQGIARRHHIRGCRRLDLLPALASPGADSDLQMTQLVHDEVCYSSYTEVLLNPGSVDIAQFPLSLTSRTSTS